MVSMAEMPKIQKSINQSSFYHHFRQLKNVFRYMRTSGLGIGKNLGG